MLIEQLSRDCISRYTKYVSSNRVLPSLDLKPIHRRLLWSLIKMGARYGSGTFRKSSSVVGTGMIYHPHGGGYPSLVTLVNQPNALVEGRGNFGNCFTGDTKISLLNGTEVEIQDLVGVGEFWVYSCLSNGAVVPGRGHSARVTKTITQLAEVILDNGETVKCTLDHRWMMRDGTYKEAQYLVEGDSLMPLYRDINSRGYEIYKNNVDSKWNTTHSMVAYNCVKTISGVWDRIKSNNLPDKHLVVHHKNFIKRNNDPSNLDWMGENEHWRYHSKLINNSLIENDFFRELTINRNRSGITHTPEIRAKRGRAISKSLKIRVLEPDYFLHSREFSDSVKISNSNRLWNQSSRDKIGNAHRGKYVSEETRLKLSIALSGRSCSQGALNALLLRNKGNTYAKGRIWINNGVVEKMVYCSSIPENFSIGRLPKNNHKVQSVKIISIENTPVYDITVDEYHNFSLSAGVFVHNCWGHSAAAERYTEVKTSQVFEHLLDPYMMEVGDFVKNYDESEIEPVIFQTKLPLILLTGVSGIGVGFSTNYPALHVSTVKDIVKSGVDDLGLYTGSPMYAYGACQYDNNTFPTISIENDKTSGKSYLRIIDIPLGSTLSSLKSSLILDLVSSGNIEIIDNSKIGKIDIKICAPADIQSLIIKSISRPLIKSLSFYWSRYRSSNFIKYWLADKVLFIKRREYYIAAKQWNKEISNTIITNITKKIRAYPNEAMSDINDLIQRETIMEHTKFISKVPIDAQIYIDTAEELVSKIKSKPLSSLKEYPPSVLPIISSLSDSDALSIIHKEVDDVDGKIFTPASKVVTSVPVAKYNQDIKKYVAMKNGEVLVSYNKVLRAVNHTVSTKDVVYIVYSDGSLDEIPRYKTGTYVSGDKKIVGYSIFGSPVALMTESNNVLVLYKLGYLKEPLISALPAEEIEVDGTVHKVVSGLKFSDVKSYKIIK